MPAKRQYSQSELLDHVSQFDLTPEAYSYVHKTITEQPSRVVGQYATGNVCGNYSSPSMGCSIQYESHGSELALILRWERDPNVLAYFDQPPPVELFRKDKNGRNIRTTYTPDYLVITRNSIEIDEAKPGAKIKALSKKYPDQWVQREEDWAYVPAEVAFAQLGLLHVVRNTSTFSRVETSNLKTLIRVANAVEMPGEITIGSIKGTSTIPHGIPSHPCEKIFVSPVSHPY